MINAFIRRALPPSGIVAVCSAWYCIIDEKISSEKWSHLFSPVYRFETTKCDNDDQSDVPPAEVTVRQFKTRGNGDSFPNFSRYGKNSLIKKYLTHQVYQKLKDKQTSSGVKLDDIIRASTCLPWGALPPRGVAGVYAGDAESYSTFAPLLDPIIEEHHHSRSRNRMVPRLQRHKTNLDPQHLAQKKLDIDGTYILYTRIRLARSLKGFRFSPCITRSERRAVEELLKECCKDWKHAPAGKYVPIMAMSNAEHEDLVKRGLLPRDPDLFAATAGTHRDWPDGRGVYMDTWESGTQPSLLIWCNVEDHFWIISNSSGGNVQDVFSRLSRAVWALETSLQERGCEFEEDSRLGFLNTSPENIGTALRASVHVKLVRLGRQPGFMEFVRRLRLQARAGYPRSDKRYSGIFDIGNLEALGKSEVELINVMIDGVSRLIELEKRLEQGEEVNLAMERV